MDLEEHLLGRGHVCVVAFSSRPDRFEWGGTLARLGVRHVLLRDSTERWYQGGIDGIGNADSVLAYLRTLWMHGMVVGLGLSSGSYAALSFGALVPFPGVIAISPITGKGDALKPDFEPRWWHRIEHGPEHPPVPDLKPLYGGRPHNRPTVRAFVSDGEGTELDRKMAERIGVTDITLIPGHSHAGLARHMRDAGIIAKLLGVSS